MKVLIFGVGFIASKIVQQLEYEGHEVMTFSRSPSQYRSNNAIIGNIFDFQEVKKALEWSPEAVIHTAWITTPGVYRDHTSNYDYAKFTINLAEYLVQTEVKHLIVLGTCAEYGLQTGPSIAGITPLSPRILYAEQKVSAFIALKNFLADSELQFNWVRIFYPYGPGQDQKRLIPQLYQALSSGSDIQLADTSSIHDWTTTRDIASAISWVLQHKLPVEIDVGTAVGYTNAELLLRMAQILNIPYNLSPENSQVFGLNEHFVVDKASPIFKSGWKPIDTLSTGLEWAMDL